MSTLEGELCRTSQEELEHDINQVEVTPEMAQDIVRMKVNNDDYLADALCEPEARELIRQIWAAIPKGRPGFRPRNLYDLLSEDAVTHRLIVDIAVRLAASITDYMEEGQ